MLMRIEKLILENWIGIWNGMNKKRIEIDFNQNVEGQLLGDKRNQVVMLIGPNGSGKTTIMSALHPFADSQDNRSNVILPNHEGYKEIHIIDKNNYYIIKHYYKKTMKSFISKNGVELNPNGGVRTFKETVKVELDVDEDFFKIGRIGSNVTNFIEFTTAERKKYISKFLPDIDDYLKKYKLVNGKFRELKKEVQYVSDQLQKLDTRENLEILKESVENQMKTKEDRASALTTAINVAKANIEQVDPDEELRNDGNPYQDSFKGSEKLLTMATKKLIGYTNKYPQLASYDIEKLNEVRSKDLQRISALQTTLDSNKVSVQSVQSSIVTSKSELKRKKEDLREIQTGESLEDLQELLESRQKVVDDLAVSIEKNNKLFSKYTGIKYQDLLPAKTILATLKDSILSVKHNLTEEAMQRLMWLQANNSFNNSSLSSSVIAQKRARSKMEKNLAEFNANLSRLEANRSKADILKLRPDDCVIDTCAFIKDALQYANIDEDIIAQETEIKAMEDKIREIDILIEEDEDMYDNYKVLNNAYKTVNGMEILSKLPCADAIESFENFAGEIVGSDIGIEKTFNITPLMNYIQSRENLQIETDKINNIKEKINYLQKQASFVNSLNDDISTLEENLEKFDGILTQLADEKQKVASEITKRQTKVDILNDLEELLKTKDECQIKMDESEEGYNKFEKILEKLSLWISSIKQYQKDLDYVNREIEPLKTQLRKVDLNLAKLDEYEQRKANLESKYEIMALVKEALDPTKGIPLKFIGGYLEKTRDIANELLDIAYKGRFKIKFELDDKNFFIQVFMDNGDMKEDVTDASQGEVALTTISISLAMIQQSMTRYNIINLDEIDSELDKENRMNFIDMLEKQMEILNIEQIFIISHNNQFDAYPVDIILTKGDHIDLSDKEFMQNKNIVFNASV
jgi:DNA repair exonuclease SbcCD ATPase subunit